MKRIVCLVGSALLLASSLAQAQPSPAAVPPTDAVVSRAPTPEASSTERDAPVALETVSVIATRVPTAEEEVPVSVTIITGRELRQRGVNDLRTALLLVPALPLPAAATRDQPAARRSCVAPAETDDYLLVVDGVPLGGAFNPTTAQIDFNNVAKVEVLRGPSPVLFGAISFAGVVSIEHYAAGDADGHVQTFVGQYGGAGVELAHALPTLGALRQSVSGTIERLVTKDPTAYADRLHGLYRGGVPLAGGDFAWISTAAICASGRRARN